MKLIKQEVEALARIKHDQEKNEIHEYNKKLRENPKVNKDAEEWLKYILKIPPDIWNASHYSKSKNSIINVLVSKKEKRYNKDLTMIEAEIIVLSMTCENAMQLKKKLGIKISA